MFNYQGIVLKKLERNQLDHLQRLKAESWATTHQVTICNMEDQERWFDSLDQHAHSPRNLVLAASHEDLKGCVGTFGIFKITNIDYINGSADTAWDVFQTYRGKGWGKRLVAAGVAFCFQILHLRRLDAEILEGNEASYNCALATGFRQEGIRCEAVHRLGEYIDSRVMGLLVQKWKERLNAVSAREGT